MSNELAKDLIERFGYLESWKEKMFTITQCNSCNAKKTFIGYLMSIKDYEIDGMLAEGLDDMGVFLKLYAMYTTSSKCYSCYPSINISKQSRHQAIIAMAKETGSLSKVGKAFNLSRERVRQICALYGFNIREYNASVRRK